MKTSFENIVNSTLDREGGFVRDPDDPGGATNMGITIGLMQAMNLDIDGDNDVDIDDVSALPREQAKDIYYQKYWLPSKAGSVPNSLREVLFDMSVNMGIKAGVRVLQRTVNAMLGRKELVEDGVNGSNTIAALIKYHPSVNRVCDYWILRYADIVAANPRLEKFWHGWCNRVRSHWINKNS